MRINLTRDEYARILEIEQKCLIHDPSKEGNGIQEMGFDDEKFAKEVRELLGIDDKLAGEYVVNIVEKVKRRFAL